MNFAPYFPKKRQRSLYYWSRENPKQLFYRFLLCLKRLNLPKLPPDMRRLLFLYTTWAIPLHTLSYRRQFDIVDRRCIVIPPNTLQCVHLSAKLVGRDTIRVRAAFWILDENIANWIQTTEKRIMASEKKNIGKNFLSCITPSKSRGYTLFYNFYLDDYYNSIDIIEYDHSYHRVNNVPLRKKNLFNYNPWQTGQPSIIKHIPILSLHKWIDCPLTLNILGRVCTDKDSKMSFRLLNGN